MLSCGLLRPRMRRSLRRARIRNRLRQCGGFEVTRMRLRVFNGLALMVSLSNHGQQLIRIEIEAGRSNDLTFRLRLCKTGGLAP
jgi:hypothetical protein